MIRILALLLALVLPQPAFAQNVVVIPTSNKDLGLASTVANNVTSLIIKATPGNLYSIYATNLTSTAGFLILVNSATVPSTGALTASTVLDCIPLQSADVSSINYAPSPPAYYSTGIVALVSSSSGTGACTTYTTGTITAYIHGVAP